MGEKPRIGKFDQRLQLDGQYPCWAQLFSGAWAQDDDGSTTYGYCTEDSLLEWHGRTMRLWAGMVFCVPGPCAVRAGEGYVVVREDYLGIFATAGPIERVGRLRYIDTCSDTLLIGPWRRGDPCINHLHFPKGIDQTMHTHPSVRIGVIARGRGVCVTPDDEFALVPGLLWYLPENTEHRFRTGNSTMDVIAWHPDSDFGPTDEDHPMLNRTIVAGEPAVRHREILTRGEIVV